MLEILVLHLFITCRCVQHLCLREATLSFILLCFLRTGLDFTGCILGIIVSNAEGAPVTAIVIMPVLFATRFTVITKIPLDFGPDGTTVYVRPESQVSLGVLNMKTELQELMAKVEQIKAKAEPIYKIIIAAEHRYETAKQGTKPDSAARKRLYSEYCDATRDHWPELRKLNAEEADLMRKIRALVRR